MRNVTKILLELMDSVIIALIAVMVVFSLFFRIYIVDGESMNSTLKDRDRLLVSQLFYKPAQGDIICFVADDLNDKILVKRVIALPGQTIDINDEYQVLIDGEVLEENYLDYGIYTVPKGFNFPYTVKDGELFCLGDNRVNSKDSRDLGPIQDKYVLGRLILRLFPNTGVVK